jgi:hypothetical protein
MRTGYILAAFGICLMLSGTGSAMGLAGSTFDAAFSGDGGPVYSGWYSYSNYWADLIQYDFSMLPGMNGPGIGLSGGDPMSASSYGI